MIPDFRDELNELEAALVSGKNDLQAMLDLPDVKFPPRVTTHPFQIHVTFSAIESITTLSLIIYKMELQMLTLEAMNRFPLDEILRHQRNLLRRFEPDWKTRTLKDIHRKLIHGKGSGFLCDFGSTPKKTILNLIFELETIETDMITLGTSLMAIK